MGLVDSLKKATGIGLVPIEHYHRAFEKGVLLGPGHYGDAAGLFAAAARKAAEAGDQALATRAEANASLYAFTATGRTSDLEHLLAALRQVSEIEAIGSQSEMIAADRLATEVEARLIEARLDAQPSDDHLGRARLHAEAAGSFQKIFGEPLVTYRFHAKRGEAHLDTAQARFFFHQGSMSWRHSLAAMHRDPAVAAEHAGKALAAFRQCRDESGASTAEEWLTKFRTNRTCWMCHREVQGAGVHFHSYPADVTPYVVALVAKLGQDASSLDSTNGSIVLCGPCGSVVEKQADRYASQRTGELRAEVSGQLAVLTNEIASLKATVAALQFRR